MSTLKTDVLKDVAETVSVDVVDLLGAVNLREDLAVNLSFRSDFASDAAFNADKAGKLSRDSTGRARNQTFIAGDEELTGATVRDAYVVGRTISGPTDCHGFADRTILASASDSGTYGSFDATTEWSAGGVLNHLYTFQGRGKYSGSGQLDNYASFYHAPNFTGTGTVGVCSGVRLLDPTGTSPITDNQGINIPNLTRGTNNYAIFSWGATPSIHVGKITLGSQTLDTAAALHVKDFSDMTTGFQSGVRSNCIGNSSAAVHYSAFSGRVQYATGTYTVPLGIGIRIEDANIGAGVTMTDQHGVHILNQTKGVNNAAVYAEVSAGTNKWGLRFVGTAQNYLNGNLGIKTSVPTAQLHLSGGTVAAGSAPIKLTAGTNLATPENGAFEFDGTNLYFTVGGVRKTVTLT